MGVNLRGQCGWHRSGTQTACQGTLQQRQALRTSIKRRFWIATPARSRLSPQLQSAQVRVYSLDHTKERWRKSKEESRHLGVSRDVIERLWLAPARCEQRWRLQEKVWYA